MIGSLFIRTSFTVLVLVIAMPVSAQTEDHAPVSMKSSSKMMQDKPGGENWTYAQPVTKFAKFRTVIVMPTKVYQGPDAQFEGIEPRWILCPTWPPRSRAGWLAPSCRCSRWSRDTWGRG